MGKNDNLYQKYEKKYTYSLWDLTFTTPQGKERDDRPIIVNCRIILNCGWLFIFIATHLNLKCLLIKTTTIDYQQAEIDHNS
jgi:hypothetical protein